MTENEMLELKALFSGETTCAVKLQGGETLVSSEKGIKPLMVWISENRDLKGSSVADKVIGRAAAFLMVLSGTKKVYTDLISEPAKDVFVKNNIDFFALKTVPNIINRTGTDICPMEKAVLNINDAKQAFDILREKIGK